LCYFIELDSSRGTGFFGLAYMTMKTKIGLKMTILVEMIFPQLLIAVSGEHTAVQLASITGN
jgi:hypothetical protein